MNYLIQKIPKSKLYLTKNTFLHYKRQPIIDIVFGYIQNK